MIRDITLGQYYASSSPIHKLDGRVKIIATLFFLVELFLVKSFLGFLVCGIALAFVVAISRVPLSFIMRGLKPVIMILIFTFVLNIFFIQGTVLFNIGPVKVTREGLYTAAFMTIRLILLIISSSMLTLTTKPLELTDAIEKLLMPLNVIGFSAHDAAMMMSIALRFIPTLLEETDKIMKAQQARGADFETGNLIARAKSLMPIIVPLFVSAFRIAQDLAMAMEARCYRGGKGRTRMNEMKFKTRDYIALALVLLFFAAVILMRIYL